MARGRPARGSEAGGAARAPFRAARPPRARGAPTEGLDLGRGQGPANLGLPGGRRLRVGGSAPGAARGGGDRAGSVGAGGGRARRPRAARPAGERLGLPRSPSAGRRLPVSACHRSRAGAARGHTLPPRGDRLRSSGEAGCGRPEHAKLGPRPQSRPPAGALRAPGRGVTRVLILSWEYPPLIEGGLARHVRKLSEALVELGADVHVLTRGGEESPHEAVVAGVAVHRVLEARRPTDLGEFVTSVERVEAGIPA